MQAMKIRDELNRRKVEEKGKMKIKEMQDRESMKRARLVER